MPRQWCCTNFRPSGCMEGQPTTWKPRTEFSKSRNPLEMVLSPLETPNVTDPWESFLTRPHTVSRDNGFCFYYKVWFGWAAEFISIKYRILVLTLRQCWNDFDFINLFCRKVSQCASAGQCRAHSLSSCGISHTNKFEVRSAIERLFAKKFAELSQRVDFPASSVFRMNYANYPPLVPSLQLLTRWSSVIVTGNPLD
jgi:hypothetical protein